MKKNRRPAPKSQAQPAVTAHVVELKMLDSNYGLLAVTTVKILRVLPWSGVGGIGWLLWWFFTHGQVPYT